MVFKFRNGDKESGADKKLGQEKSIVLLAIELAVTRIWRG